MLPVEYCLMALRFDLKAMFATRVASLLVAFLTLLPTLSPMCNLVFPWEMEQLEAVKGLVMKFTSDQ